jgi:hypothetical protein
MQKWRGNESRKMKILSKHPKEMLEKKTTIKQMKNIFGEVSRLG